eukprot:gene3652-8327_t
MEVMRDGTQRGGRLLDDALSHSQLTRILVFNMLRFISLCLATMLLYFMVVWDLYMLVLCISCGIVLLLRITQQLHREVNMYRRTISPTYRVLLKVFLFGPFLSLQLFEAGLLQCQRFLLARIPTSIFTSASSSLKVVLGSTVFERSANRLHYGMSLVCHAYSISCQSLWKLQRSGNLHLGTENSTNASDNITTHLTLLVCLQDLPRHVLETALCPYLSVSALVRLSATCRSLYHLVHTLPVQFADENSLLFVDNLTQDWQTCFNAWQKTLPFVLPFHPATEMLPESEYDKAFGVSIVNIKQWPANIFGRKKALEVKLICFIDCVVDVSIIDYFKGSSRVIFRRCTLRNRNGEALDLTTWHPLTHLVIDNPRRSIDWQEGIMWEALTQVLYVKISGDFEIPRTAFSSRNKVVHLRGVRSSDLSALEKAKEICISEATQIFGLSCLYNVQKLELTNVRGIYPKAPLPVYPSLDVFEITSPVPSFLPSLNMLSNVKHVSISHCAWLTDLTPLENAVSVVLSDCDNLYNVVPLKHVNIVTLIDCPRLSNVCKLTHVMSLTLIRVPCADTLQLSSTTMQQLVLQDLENACGLGCLPNLVTLHIEMCHAMKSVPSLPSLLSLTIKDCDGLWNLLSFANVPVMHVSGVDALVPGPVTRSLAIWWRCLLEN